MAARRNLWLRITREYVASKCDDKGRQLETNISPQMLHGIKSLRKRIKDSEIVIVEADKGKVITVSQYESYLRQGEVHTSKDTPISLEDARKCQVANNSIAKMLGNVFCIGAATGVSGRERAMSNLASMATSIPI